MLQKITINAILSHIDECIEKHPININILVQYSGYSRRYLQLLFYKELGIPIGKYIQRRRITRAALLLRLTRLPITLISERLCYDSQQTFTREFRKHTGYTPLRYRKSEIWTFKNQTGHRDLKTLLPVPQITVLPQVFFSGVSIKYTGRIPHTYNNAKKKWDIVNSIISKKTKLYVTNAISPGKKSSNEFNIETIIHTSEANPDTKINTYKNIYAYFTYKGKINDYVYYVNNLYLNVLPFYGLQRRNDYDLEIISTQPDGEYCFEYYLPIYKDSCNIHPSK
ncbi:helix-turn-helix domain-containing protein [Escherichia coli]|uniref:helix-turn-helix domain-containing protein n=1 Tax=Escherichia coli TaxID=562 RepID=UPI00184C394C|nr:helix-turn-helix domain-containing protein [Escherichia coli]MBB8028956.1 AraC family transcriptional regulator [Escherichia coli]MBB8072284.1 AraC family transcriptional regulator [Escherichia coli]MCV3049131.1 helix-turn-helix domain-containing protein [Escherichia coli]MCV3064844.1 helix-turn-helix domain-containing protein [Escherichia coli]